VDRIETNKERLRQCAVDQWSQYAGGRSILIAANLDDARRQLILALKVVEQEPILLPVNATQSLVESVKQHGAQPILGDLDQDLALCNNRQVRVAWMQPPLGLPTENQRPAEIAVLDHGDTVPVAPLDSREIPWRADVEVFGLHLSPDPGRAGALLVYNNEALYARMLVGSTKPEPIIHLYAIQQLERLRWIVPRQRFALETVWTGLQKAAGLPLLPASTGAALAHGVAVQIPAEGSPATFWTYARGENTPVQWMPELRPVHYAWGLTTRTAANLERWFFVPVHPDNDEEANTQAILGIVKTAEHLGLRWRTDPVCAAQYAALLTEMYGLDHDAYRPAFAIDANLVGKAMFDAEGVQVCAD
jgi:hypothetical protein